MDETSKYIPPDWDLRNWARIAYAASLWDKPNIELLIKAKSKTELAAQIKELVRKKEKEIHLPKAILDQVLWTFKSMGERIHEWCNYARQILKIPKDIAEKVHWTTYGTIDERKMLQDLLSSEEFKEGRHLVPSVAIYYLACSSVFIEYINLHWEEMLTFYEANEKPILLNYEDSKVRKLIIASVIFFANRNDSRIPVSYVEKYSDVKNMFKLSITRGFPTAARYYWCQLNENQKNELMTTVETVTSDCFYIMYLYPSRNTSLYKSRCVADLLIFFLSSMSDDDLKIREYKKFQTPYILEYLICHCPFKEFLPFAYDLISNYGSYEECLLESILRGMDRNNAFGFWNKQIFARKLFKFVWNREFNDFQDFMCDNKDLAKQIFQVFDLEILDFLINTGYEDGKHRYTLINKFQNKFVEIMKKNQWEWLEKFATDILRCEKDRIWFRDMFCNYLLSINDIPELPDIPKKS